MEILPLKSYILFFAGSFALSLILTPLVRKLARATGQVAVPKDSRWHRKETALLGGVGIFVAMMTVLFVAAGLVDWSFPGRPYLPMVICFGAMFALGLADDIFDMDPQHKLAGQIVIASVLVFFGLRLGWTDSKTVNLFLTILWIVGITNAFNLLDNMDGLAAGVAFIAGAFLFLFLYLNPNSNTFAGPVLLMSATYLGAILGFLIYNFNPASIFMGDAGSLFIGFVLACLTVAGSPPHLRGTGFFNLLSVIAIPILILFIPILDTGFVSFMRKLFRRPISQGGRDHSSHRMVAIGFSERRAVLVLYAFSAMSGLIALAINYFSIGTSLVVIILYLLFVLFFWIYLAKVKVYQEKSILSDDASGVFTPILVEITYRRRLFEVLLDLVLISVAYYTSYLLRFEGAPGANLDFFLKSLPILIACQIIWFYIFGIYKGVWESTGVRELTGYIKAITAGTVMAMLIFLFVYRFQSFSRAVFVIYWILMLILVSLSRLSFRLLDEGVKRGGKKGKPTLIYGAGIGGQMAVKEIENNQELGLALVGFVDDKVRIHGRKILSYPVLGGRKDLEKIIKRHNISKVIISFKKQGTEKKKEIRKLCSGMNAEVEVVQMKLIIG
ncbi:MAG: glycosyl transferase [Deltaproteobacteria bacterium]|nr:glycosyl transferase [Deltaproteobacteria bacterium]MBW2345824.1 glycosyl transferase [Deltaproteobacteria bacterium]